MRRAWRTASRPAPVGIDSSTVAPMITAATIAQMSGLADQVYVDPAVIGYVAELAEESRRQPHVKLGLSPATTSVAYLLAPSPLPEIRANHARPGCPPAFFREPAGWFAADKSHSRAKEFITSFTGNLPKYFR